MTVAFDHLPSKLTLCPRLVLAYKPSMGGTMMRKLQFALFLLMTLAIADFAVQGAAQGQVNYYPMKEGSKWYYHTELPGTDAQTWIMHVAKLEKIDGVPLFRLEMTKKDSGMTATEHLRIGDDGVFRYRFNGQPASKPVCVIKYPVKPGETWQNETEIGGQKVKMSSKVGNEEEVAVPAGKFKTMPVYVQADLGGLNMNTTYWFAANVGIVKQVVEFMGQKVTQSLEKYEAAK